MKLSSYQAIKLWSYQATGSFPKSAGSNHGSNWCHRFAGSSHYGKYNSDHATDQSWHESLSKALLFVERDRVGQVSLCFGESNSFCKG